MADHQALYRQYRPQTFDEVVGQDAAVSALKESIRTGNISHAYLFCGQHGTGKTTIAKIFARAVNCESHVNGNPCNGCATCRSILSSSNLDIHEMDAASHTGVDDIRQILQEVTLSSAQAKYKVYIIDEVHMLSKGAFNALLKTIEEPPKNVIFIFATTELDKVPSTIVSRCQKYEFHRIPVDLITARLRDVCNMSGIKASEDALHLIAMKSDGALRDALSILDQVSITAGKDNAITTIDVENAVGLVDKKFLCRTANSIIDGNGAQVLQLCEELSKSSKNLQRFILDLAGYFRDLLVIRTGSYPGIDLPYTPEDLQDLANTANKVNNATITALIQTLYRGYNELGRSPDELTQCQVMLLSICGRKINLPVTQVQMPNSPTL